MKHNEHLIKVGDGQPVRINRQETAILELLMANINKVVARSRMEAAVWGETPSCEHSLNNSIARLRTHLRHSKGLALKTVYKVGYVLAYIIHRS